MDYISELQFYDDLDYFLGIVTGNRCALRNSKIEKHELRLLRSECTFMCFRCTAETGECIELIFNTERKCFMFEKKSMLLYNVYDSLSLVIQSVPIVNKVNKISDNLAFRVKFDSKCFNFEKDDRGNFIIRNNADGLEVSEADLRELKTKIVEEILKEKFKQGHFGLNGYLLQICFSILKTEAGVQNIPGINFKFSPIISDLKVLKEYVCEINKSDTIDFIIMNFDKFKTLNESLICSGKEISHTASFLKCGKELFLLDSSLASYLHIFKNRNLLQHFNLKLFGISDTMDDDTIFKTYSVQDGNTCSLWTIFLNIELLKDYSSKEPCKDSLVYKDNNNDNPSLAIVDYASKIKSYMYCCDYRLILLRAATSLSNFVDRYILKSNEGKSVVVLGDLQSNDHCFRYSKYDFNINGEKTHVLILKKAISSCLDIGRLENIAESLAKTYPLTRRQSSDGACCVM